MLSSLHHTFGSFFVYSFFHLESIFYLSFPNTGLWTGLADCELVLCRLELRLEGEGSMMVERRGRVFRFDVFGFGFFLFLPFNGLTTG